MECSLSLNQPSSSMQRAWRSFQAGDASARNALVEAYLPLVRAAAERMYRRLAAQVALDDLVSSGVLGLMAAVQTFDPRRGVKFETYCAPRIRGAMLDELRSMDWIPRLTRTRHRRLAEAIQRLEATTGRQPTPDEISQALCISLNDVRQIQNDSHIIEQMSLEHVLSDADGVASCLEDGLPSHREQSPQDLALADDLKELIQRGLSRAERLVLLLYHYEGMTLREVGAALGVSESRVCQMHAELLARLRAKFDRFRPATRKAA